MPYLKAPPMIAASTTSALTCQTVRIGAPVVIASIARRNNQGITLVMADDATTISRPTEKEIQYGL